MMFTIVAKKKKTKDAWLALDTWEKIEVEKYARFDNKAISHKLLVRKNRCWMEKEEEKRERGGVLFDPLGK